MKQNIDTTYNITIIHDFAWVKKLNARTDDYRTRNRKLKYQDFEEYARG